MPPDTAPPTKPVTSTGGWNEVLRMMSHVVPARLYHTQRAVASIRALRR